MPILWFLTTTVLAALPAELDPRVTPSIGRREDAVVTIAKHPEATVALIEVMQGDPAPEVRVRAAAALFARWASGAGDDALYEGIASWAAESATDLRIRVAAVRALGEVGDDYTLVVPYLTDEDPDVRAAALAACERWAGRHPGQAAEVREALRTHRRSPPTD